jgi:RHS repeat-associated protein
MRRIRRSLVVLVAVVALLPIVAFSQVATGTPPFGSFGGGPDVINESNLNIHWSFPIIAKAGRGIPFNYSISFDNSVWQVANHTWQPVDANTMGWTRQTEALTGYVSYSSRTIVSGSPPSICGTAYFNWVYHDPAGTAHPFLLAVDTPSCGSTQSASGRATDGSGYAITISYPPSATVYLPSGGSISPPLQNQTGAASITDTNGNYISTGDGAYFTDTLGTSAFTINNVLWGAPYPDSYTYQAPGGSKSVSIGYTTYNVQTNFGCSGTAEYGPTSVPLLTSITYSDGSSYQFQYEDTPGYVGNKTGRLSKVTLPTGGTISYSYWGGAGNLNGIFCDGTTAAIARTVGDGVNSWQGSFWIAQNANSTTTTHVNTPQGDETIIDFSGGFETQRQIWHGPSSAGQGIETVLTCWNGVSSGTCGPGATVTPPIQNEVRYTELPGTASRHDDYFDGNGNLTETDDYDWGYAYLGKKQIAYASLGNILDRASSVTSYDAAGTMVAQTNYAYDETGLGSLAGTPQHRAPPQTQRGNLTTISQWVQGTTYLSQHLSYLDTGNVLDAYDVNGARTHYFYDSNPAVSCGNSFSQASGNMDLGVYTWTDWNCAGAVPSVTRGPNYQPTTTAWNDPNFWRPTSVTDPLGNVTNTNYASPTLTETGMWFNSNQSFTDSLPTLDGLGRPHVIQRRQGPGSLLNVFDSAETDYDSDGRPSRSTTGYVATSIGQTNSTAPATTITYDALGRPTLVTDAGGGTVAYDYSNNDVLVTAGSPNTERQYEYDALGRLTSVCELTSGTGSGTCGQSRQYTGYWTKYSYDAAGHLLTVTQNAQAAQSSQQTRSFTYDGLGRMTSETNPETGTTTYVYDSTAGSSCNTAGYGSPGDLVRKVDASGNNSCYYHDALHRLTDVGIVSGNTVSCKRFRYDNSTGIMGSIPAGVSISNPLGHMVEAETDNCAWPVTAPITDEWFSYTARGEVSDVYQSTPHSRGYYDVKQSYWEHGLPKQLSGLPGLPAITYGGTISNTAYNPPVSTIGLDGEGRVTQVTASAGQNPVILAIYVTSVTSTDRQPIGALSELFFGSGDTDGFRYDPNTGRLVEYSFLLGPGQGDVGELAWNANGSLKQLTINDSIPGTVDSQTCNYSHDDLGRITGADCGTAWNQTFTYDPFGNITKNGSVTYQPAYNPATNRVTNTGFTYDSNGDFTSDVFRNYSWDAEGKMTSVTNGAATVNLTYDALGRMVEQVRNGDTNCSTTTDCTQIVYGPGGGKLALMNGQTLNKAFMPLPGGATAVYNSSGLQYYRHSDHLGSSRLASTPSHGLYYSGAYAPFGEPYKEAGITTDHAFTGQNEDTITALADFTFREYGFTHSGRWISPDPAGLSAADPTDPQSWNRYAYVVNNPLSLVDPLGLDWSPCSGGGFCTTTGWPDLPTLFGPPKPPGYWSFPGYWPSPVPPGYGPWNDTAPYSMYGPSTPVGGHYYGGDGWNDPFFADAKKDYQDYQNKVRKAYVLGLPASDWIAFFKNPQLGEFVVRTLKDIQKDEMAAFKAFLNSPLEGGYPPEIKVNPSKCIFVGVPGPTRCPVKPVMPSVTAGYTGPGISHTTTLPEEVPFTPFFNLFRGW